MDNSLPWFFWLFPIAFTLHNIEEAIYLPEWSKSAGRYHKPVDAFEFRFALIIITALAIIITYLFFQSGKQSFACYLYFAFNFGMLINVFFPHLIATIVLKKYAPGLLTGLILILPATVYILYYGNKNHYFVFPAFWYFTIPFAVILAGSIPLLFRLGRSIKKLST